MNLFVAYKSRPRSRLALSACAKALNEALKRYGSCLGVTKLLRGGQVWGRSRFIVGDKPSRQKRPGGS